MSFALFHQLNPPDEPATLEDVGFGTLNTEFTGSLASSVPAEPTVKAEGFAGFYQGFLPTPSNVSNTETFGSPPVAGTLIPTTQSQRKNMSTKTQSVVGFPVRIPFVFRDENQALMELANGPADASMVQIKLIKADNTEFLIDPALGVFFDQGGTDDAGQYQMILDGTALTDLAGTAVDEPVAGDKFEVIGQALHNGANVQTDVKTHVIIEDPNAVEAGRVSFT